MKGRKPQPIFRIVIAAGLFGLVAGILWFWLRPAQVSITEAAFRKMSPSIHGIGTVESKVVVIIAAKIPGKITSVNVDQGDTVASGQVLATLEDSELRAEIERAEATLERSRSTADVRRAEIQRSLTGIEIQSAAVRRAIANTELPRAALRRAKSALSAAETNIARTQAMRQQARNNATRWITLERDGIVSKMDTEERVTQATTADEDLKNAVAQRNVAIEDVKNSEAVIKTSDEDVRHAQAQLKAAYADVETLRAGLKVIEQEILTAEAALDSANARKADGVIISQITGYVVSRELEPGAVVNPGTPILKVADPTTIWATAYIDEVYARSFEAGDPADITLRSMQTDVLKGKVARIRRESDRVTEQIAVDISFDQIPEDLRLGEQLEVVIKPGPKTAKAIPASALISSKEGPGVWLVEDGRLRFRRVQTGLVDSGGWTEVIEGVEEGEKVVVSPGKLSDPINEGRAVSIVAEKKKDDPPKL